MGARTRTRILAPMAPGNRKAFLWSGGAWLPAGTLSNSSGIAAHESNSDVTMAPPYNVPHTLSIQKKIAEPLSINGTITGGSFKEEFSDYQPLNRASYAYVPSMTNAVNWGQLKTKAMARMNPSKPAVDLPVFIFEFKDFPRMLQQLGRVLAKKVKASDVAGGYVAYSFGWAPLISDLGKLLNLSKLIDDRARNLKRMEDRKSSRKQLGKHGPFTTSLADYVVSGWVVPGQVPFRSGQILVEQGTYWATGKVNLVGKLPTGFDERRWLAARAALGLNLSAASLWEAMPWSWLIDYFSNVGDILDAQRGFIPVTYKDICVMARIDVENKLSGSVVRSGLSVTGGTLKSEYKLRTVYIAPSASLHFDSMLTNHQMGILASLTTASALRRIGK